MRIRNDSRFFVLRLYDPVPEAEIPTEIQSQRWSLLMKTNASRINLFKVNQFTLI